VVSELVVSALVEDDELGAAGGVVVVVTLLLVEELSELVDVEELGGVVVLVEVDDEVEVGVVGQPGVVVGVVVEVLVLVGGEVGGGEVGQLGVVVVVVDDVGGIGVSVTDGVSLGGGVVAGGVVAGSSPRATAWTIGGTAGSGVLGIAVTPLR